MSRRIDKQINSELYRAVKNLGAKSDLLSIVGSRFDTLTDDVILEMLREWNKYTEAEMKKAK